MMLTNREKVLALSESLSQLAWDCEMNGPAQWLLAEMMEEEGRVFEDMTVRDLRDLLDRHRVRYNKEFERAA